MKKDNPHAILGIQGQGREIYLHCPSEDRVYLEVLGKGALFDCVGHELFKYVCRCPLSCLDYRIRHPSGLIAHDPYAFAPTFSQSDERSFNEGNHGKIWEVMGGRLCTHQGVQGVKFAVWAPHALSVGLVGDFNRWDVKKNPMRKIGIYGVWELFVPGLGKGERYKFAIETPDKEVVLKADPYAYQGEVRPQTASVVAEIGQYVWGDREWMEKRGSINEAPFNVYKLHLGSWKRGTNGFRSYRELAPLIADFIQEMGFTHVEVLPVMEHPLDESWGYEVTGYYAISSRFGMAQDFQYFVDYLHQRGIGIIFDWVPAHFPKDPHGLAQFDGTCLYECEDPQMRNHPKWGTLIFDYQKKEVINFLIGSALFYLEVMHVDGLRVDAVSSILYLDFEREGGAWKSNREGGCENMDGAFFLKRLNACVHARFPSALMIAEESRGYSGVTDPDGLGFDLRWDLGWSADVLKFLKAPYYKRADLFDTLIHEMTYFYSERHLLPLSHDDVTCGKGSLLSKMVGSEWEQFAQLRLLLSYMITHPGKKLLFMGGELGQKEEWDCRKSLPWELLDLPFHRGVSRCVSDLNALYFAHPALYVDDFSPNGFEWIEPFDKEHLVLAYLRKGQGESLLCVHHFSPLVLNHYSLPYRGKGVQIFSTDLKEYGGFGIVEGDVKIEKETITLTLPPLATLVLTV